MSDDGVDDVSIPLVFLFASEARPLLDMLNVKPDLLVTISELPKGNYFISYLFKSVDINNNTYLFLETEAEVDSIENTGTMINNSIDKLKKIIGNIMTSNDPTQVQLNFILLAFVIEFLFSVILFLCRYRLGR